MTVGSHTILDTLVVGYDGTRWAVSVDLAAVIAIQQRGDGTSRFFLRSGPILEIALSYDEATALWHETRALHLPLSA